MTHDFENIDISVGIPGDYGTVGDGSGTDDDEDEPCPEDVKMVLGFDPDDEPDVPKTKSRGERQTESKP